MPPPLPSADLLASVSAFAAAGGRPLRVYQQECAEAIAESVLRGLGKTFTVMFARQMGKNETSAQLEAYLLALHAGRGGTLVKAAPSFQPQVITSLLRLRGVLEANPVTRGRAHGSYGYMLSVGRASIALYSADPHANVVGATASLLLEIDEAQDVDPDKYDREFRPMAAAHNATTVLYGTAWAESSLLERQRRINLETQAAGGERLHFEYDWRALAALSPAYGRYVQGEIARLGAEHPTIRTQYLLQPLADAGRMFSAEQRARLQGTHPRVRVPEPDVTYVMGIDLAGEDEQGDDAAARALTPRRDSTVVTIAALRRDGSGLPAVRVVEHVWWTGRDHVWQFQHLAALCERWGPARVCVDASGIGGIAAFLAARLGERVERVTFSAPVKSALGFDLLGLINAGRIALYSFDGSPEAVQCRRELELCRSWARSGERMAWGVPESEGHDDFVISLALCARAAGTSPAPAAGGLIRAPAPDREA